MKLISIKIIISSVKSIIKRTIFRHLQGNLALVQFSRFLKTIIATLVRYLQTETFITLEFAFKMAFIFSNANSAHQRWVSIYFWNFTLHIVDENGFTFILKLMFNVCWKTPDTYIFFFFYLFVELISKTNDFYDNPISYDTNNIFSRWHYAKGVLVA